MEVTELIDFAHHNIALVFCDYLRSLNIHTELRSNDSRYTVLCDVNAWQQAKTLCDEFIEQPHHPKYQQAAWQSNNTVDVNVHAAFSEHGFIRQFLQHAGAVTLVIFAICWLVYLASALGWWREVFSHLRFFTPLTISALIEQPYRLIGPAFFHFSLLHIAFNTMWWWQLGGSVERVLGKRALVLIFLVSALLSNVGQYVVSGANFGGLSGVVYALVGFVWWYGWLAPNKGLMLPKSIVGFMLFFLVLGFVDLLPVATANAAHLIGLLSGCLLAWLTVNNHQQQSKLSNRN